MAKKSRFGIIMIVLVIGLPLLLANCRLPLPFLGAAEASPQPTSTSTLTETLTPTAGSMFGDKAIPTATKTFARGRTATPTPKSALVPFTDPTYRIALEYPNKWNLFAIPPGRKTANGFAAKTLQLTKGDLKLLVQYKFKWEDTVMGSPLPSGELAVRDTVSLLDKEIPKQVIVSEGKDVYVFYGGSTEDLDFHISLDSSIDNVDGTPIEIPAEAQEQAEALIASITRTGEPFNSPTPTATPSITPIPTATSRFASSKSGSGSGSTVAEGCNKANFVDDVNLGTGAVIPPGAKFTKVWRIQNTGFCTWTRGYSLVYSTGDFAGEESVPMPEEVLPGEAVNIGVEFTAPEKEGHYQSHYIFHDSQGYWFGLGEGGRGFVTLDINVAKPDVDYAYDLALNYCDAAWESYYTVENKDGELEEKIIELDCPSDVPSSNGFVALLSHPKLEFRNENELTLWVHPYEQKYGWTQGTYPAYEVQPGDHFRVWVGCLQDMPKCSLAFQILYEDENGDVRNLGKELAGVEVWQEQYDGDISRIDLDLSSLVGQKIKFILKTVGNTLNHDSAQGFWFVPRVENP